MDNIILTTIISSLTAVSGFYYGWQRDKKDLITKSLNNIQVQIQIYEQLIDSLRSEIENLIIKVEEQEKIIHSLELKIDSIKKNRNKE